VDGADSITFRLMFNSLRSAYEPALDALSELLAGEVSQVAAYRSLARAIELGNGRLAHTRADALLRRGHEQIGAALDSLTSH